MAKEDDKDVVRTSISIPRDLWNQMLEEAERLGGLSAASMLRIVLAQRYRPQEAGTTG